MKLALALVIAGGLTYRTGSTLIGAAAGVVAYLLTSWRLVREELRHRGHRWWAEPNLVRAFMDAGILPALKKDQRPHVLGRRGKPQADASGGTAVKVALPAGISFSQVRERRERLASALGIPTAHLDLTQRRGDKANEVRVWVGVGTREPRTAPIATATVTDWTKPALIGTDDRGRDATIATQGTHTGLVGGTGSGKTWLGRVMVSHAILDPHVHIDAIIAKDNINDWRPMAPRCGTYIGGATKAAVERVEQLLLEVEADSEDRQSQQNPPPRVLVVEEWYRMRLAANRVDRDMAKRLDSLMGELLATARSANIHIIMLAQRGTVEYLPGDQKANLLQRLVGSTGSEAEVRYVLDKVPQKLPTPPGEFLVSTEEREPVLVRVDRLDDAGFADLCRQAPKVSLRPDFEPAAVEQEAPAEPPTDPLLLAVLTVLTANTEGLPSGDLLAHLPEPRPANPIALGKALGRFEQQGWVERARTFEGGRLWRLSGSGRRGSGVFDMSVTGSGENVDRSIDRRLDR